MRNGKVTEEVYKSEGLYGEAIDKLFYGSKKQLLWLKRIFRKGVDHI